MSTQTLLSNGLVRERWTPETVKALSPQLAADEELAEFVAAAPAMARALAAVLNMDLGETAERRVRAEVNSILGRAARAA